MKGGPNFSRVKSVGLGGLEGVGRADPGWGGGQAARDTNPTHPRAKGTGEAEWGQGPSLPASECSRVPPSPSPRRAGQARGPEHWGHSPKATQQVPAELGRHGSPHAGPGLLCSITPLSLLAHNRSGHVLAAPLHPGSHESFDVLSSLYIGEN